MKQNLFFIIHHSFLFLPEGRRIFFREPEAGNGAGRKQKNAKNRRTAVFRMLRNRSGAEEIIAPGGKDIQEDAFFQADGSVLQAGGNHD